jgi:predicted ribosome quality control (RQC) complex YloA/Tae2 family protein
MQISLNFTKTVQENAAIYFEKAKKAKKKKEGAEKALLISKKNLDDARYKQEQVEVSLEKRARKVQRKKEWYEKFRWFYSSEGFLVIGGRDVVTNEIIVKKHMDKDDMVMHTDMQGSPFFIVKAEGKKVGDRTLQEAAAATAMYSRAWKLGFLNVTVRAYKPEQISKTAKHGEYLTRGAFILSGKGLVVEHDMCFAIGFKEDKIIAGPLEAVKEHASKFVEIVQGDEKPSALAKKLKKLFGVGDSDEIIRMLPAGNAKIKK